MKLQNLTRPNNNSINSPVQKPGVWASFPRAATAPMGVCLVCVHPTESNAWDWLMWVLTGVAKGRMAFLPAARGRGPAKAPRCRQRPRSSEVQTLLSATCPRGGAVGGVSREASLRRRRLLGSGPAASSIRSPLARPGPEVQGALCSWSSWQGPLGKEAGCLEPREHVCAHCVCVCARACELVHVHVCGPEWTCC